jgi:hypothetical protein
MALFVAFATVASCLTRGEDRVLCLSLIYFVDEKTEANPAKRE